MSESHIALAEDEVRGGDSGIISKVAPRPSVDEEAVPSAQVRDLAGH